MSDARRLLKNAATHFSPETVTMLGGVFDDAWATVKLRPHDHAATLRKELADAIMDLAMAGQLDPEKLKALALARLHRSMG